MFIVCWVTIALCLLMFYGVHCLLGNNNTVFIDVLLCSLFVG